MQVFKLYRRIYFYFYISAFYFFNLDTKAVFTKVYISRDEISGSTLPTSTVWRGRNSNTFNTNSNFTVRSTYFSFISFQYASIQIYKVLSLREVLSIIWCLFKKRYVIPALIELITRGAKAMRCEGKKVMKCVLLLNWKRSSRLFSHTPTASISTCNAKKVIILSVTKYKLTAGDPHTWTLSCLRVCYAWC